MSKFMSEERFAQRYAQTPQSKDKQGSIHRQFMQYRGPTSPVPATGNFQTARFAEPKAVSKQGRTSKKRQPTKTLSEGAKKAITQLSPETKAKLMSKVGAVLRKKRQPTKTKAEELSDELFGCDELSCGSELGSLFDLASIPKDPAARAEWVTAQGATISKDNNIFSQIGNAVKKAVGAATDLSGKVLDNPLTKAIVPVTALANSDVGMKVGAVVPGISGVVNAGATIKAWASDSGVALPPEVAKWAANATGDVIPSEIATLARNAGVKIPGVPANTASSKTSGGGIFGNLLSAPLAGLKAAVAQGVNNASANLVASAAPVPMTVAAEPAPGVAVSVQPWGASELAAVMPQVETRFGNTLTDMANQVKLTSLQMQATSEHKALAKEAQFKRNLLSGLKQIAANTRRS